MVNVASHLFHRKFNLFEWNNNVYSFGVILWELATLLPSGAVFYLLIPVYQPFKYGFTIDSVIYVHLMCYSFLESFFLCS